MTDIEQKALELLKECVGNAIWKHPITRINRQSNLEHEALCRAIEQHEAYKQEVSHNVRLYREEQPYIWKQSASGYFSHFIIPAPQPDTLVEVLTDVNSDYLNTITNETYAKALLAALEARGLEIRSKNDG